MKPLRAASAVLVLCVAACSGAAVAPSASPSPAPTTIATAADAAARVVVIAPHLAGIAARDPELIGGCCFWEAVPAGDGFQVTYQVGWGDCPSGCIERHRWTYEVSRDGAVRLVGEDGPPVPAGVPGAVGSGTGGGGILPGGSGIEGKVHAGPTCPVVKIDDPSCDDRPVAGATLLVLDAGGSEVARLITDAAGHFGATLPPGNYRIEPQPVEGFFRTSEPVAVTVGDGFVNVDIAMDTGIR